MQSSWPDSSILRAYPHFYVLAPRGFTCGHTEKAVDAIVKMQRPVLKYKDDNLDVVPLPAFDKRPFMPMEELAEKRNDCVIVPGRLNFQQAKEVAGEMVSGWPQIYLFVPSIQKYVYIGGLSFIVNNQKLLDALFDREVKREDSSQLVKQLLQ
jgi:hypothetical protein